MGLLVVVDDVPTEGITSEDDEVEVRGTGDSCPA
jgi:hypothetical protein